MTFSSEDKGITTKETETKPKKPPNKSPPHRNSKAKTRHGPWILFVQFLLLNRKPDIESESSLSFSVGLVELKF